MRTLCLLALTFASAGLASAADGLSDALEARARLGPDVWARVVSIENPRAKGLLHRSSYPKTVYAVVFELSGVLWFYTDTDGTQSLSLTLGTAEADKANPGPLFRAIDAGFAGWTWVDEPVGWRPTRSAELPNGCFVESVAALLRRVAVGRESLSPRLLSYYVDTPLGRRGHTVLLFGTHGGLSAVDPERSDRPMELPAFLGSDPRALSAYLRGGPVAAARTVPIDCARKAAPAGQWAMLPKDPSPEG